MQIKYYKNWDASVSLVSKVEGGAGHGNISGPCKGHLVLVRLHRAHESSKELGCCSWFSARSLRLPFVNESNE